MIGGPLDPVNIARHAIDFTPAGARFVLECCIERGVELDGDTALLLREIGRSDRPKWEPRTASELYQSKMASRGILHPEERKKIESKIESREVDLETGEEKTL